MASLTQLDWVYAQTVLSLPFRLLTLGALCSCRLECEGGETPIAYVDNDDAQFQFACRGGDLAMAYWVRKPGEVVAAAQSLSLAMNSSGGNVSDGNGTGFAQDFPMIQYDGSSVLIRGPVARQWARTAQQAVESIELAFVKSKSSGELEFLDRRRFGAKGSSGGIAKVLGQCG